jgi:diadenosine tetraphosphatase ApaH/serine/threonine PP2A family protein phosphatase
MPVIYQLAQARKHVRLSIPDPNTCILLQPRSILNPGSVGQPRDRDVRAAYAIYDSENETWDYRRVAYDIVAVQDRMKAAELPERHIQRLAMGW